MKESKAIISDQQAEVQTKISSPILLKIKSPKAEGEY